MKTKSPVKIFVFCLILVAAIFTAGCAEIADERGNFNEDRGNEDKEEIVFEDSYKADDKWLVYWYVCGSNLETNYASASKDIQEMLKAKLPPNVKVLIQAGGSKKWQNAVMKSDKTNIYLYDENGLSELETSADSDMGAPETLATFLQYGKDKFDVDHRIFVFWDHGGGSVFGVSHDERTNNSLDLNEIRNAFVSVFDASEENPPFEIVGFDTCLMATYEMANDLYGLTRYMVASEEVEPGNGWQYTGWIAALGNNPAMGGDALGQIICDTYYSGCEDAFTEDAATLSVVDVTKIPQLRQAYENFGVEALKLSKQDPIKFFSTLGRHAKRSENYGGNTREKGYYNMIDLGDLAQRSKNLLPQTSENLIDAIDETVVYKVNGIYRDKGKGISGYYPYDGNPNVFGMYNKVSAAPLAQKCLYYHLLYGTMPKEAENLINNQQVQNSLQPSGRKKIFTIEDLEDIPVKVDKKNNAYVKLTQKQMDILSSVNCNLAYVDVDADVVVYLGSDADVIEDWEKGIFTDNFKGTWPMLDGHPVYIEVTANNEKYILYSIPIKLNGVRCNLEVAFDRNKSAYKVLGARREETSRGMADKNLIKLKAGDEITTLHYGISISGDDSDFTEVEVDTFKISDNPEFNDEAIDDGEYLYCFEFVTPDNETATSEFINFTIKDGKIYTSELED